MISSNVRLYQPEEAPGPRKLRECYDEWLRPEHELKATAGTISDYETTLKHWEAKTGDPLVSEVCDATIHLFTAAMLTDHKEVTVNKNLRNLKTILRRCCPQGVSPRGQTHGRHVLEWLPRIEMLPEDAPEPRAIDLRELEAIYRACSVATLVRGSVPAPLVWRTLILTGYTFGIRTRDLFTLHRTTLSLDPPCPHARLRKLEHPHGWISYIATKTRKYKPYPLHLPIPERLRLHFDALLQVLGGDRLFPVGNRVPDWQEQWRVIQREARIAETYRFKELRQSCATQWNDIAEGLGEHVLGHAKLSVHRRHYDQMTRRLLQHVAEFPFGGMLLL